MSIKTTLEYFKEIQAVTIDNMDKLFPPAPSNSMFDRAIYRTGDGDYVQPLRPGSEDHKQWKSKGLLSSNLG